MVASQIDGDDMRRLVREPGSYRPSLIAGTIVDKNDLISVGDGFRASGRDPRDELFKIVRLIEAGNDHGKGRGCPSVPNDFSPSTLFPLRHGRYIHLIFSPLSPLHTEHARCGKRL